MKLKLIRMTTVPISLKVLLRGQLRYMKSYFDVVGVSSGGRELDEVAKDEGIRTIRLEMSREMTPVKDIISLLKMIYLISREKPDIVHTHTPKAGIVGMLAAWLMRVPHRLHTVAGLPLVEHDGIKKKILLLVEKATYFCATRVYPNSHGLKEIILENRLASRKKVKVIGNGSSNGIDVEYFKLTPEIEDEAKSLRSKYGIADNDFVFIFVGRITKDKGIEELLSAFVSLAKEMGKVRLLLVGNFEHSLDPISEKSKAILDSDDRILEMGFQHDVRPFFAMSDCLVFPSYREGFPNVVLQAGAMGLPAIVSDINGCNEIVENAINGLIIPPKNPNALYEAMVKMMVDETLRKRMSTNARDMIVKRYEQKLFWQMIKKEYDLILEDSTKKSHETLDI